MSSTATALTVVERAERSDVARELSSQSRALLSLLPDEAAVRRFQRVTVQALAKNPDLMECTPDSVVAAVMEAAAMGLEPTGAVGGAHLVPFNVNVGTKDNPRWAKKAQLIPDVRGVARLLTRPYGDGTPSDVVSIDARVVKEGDDFAWSQGTEDWVRHVPTLAPDRSQKPTTHAYAIFRLRAGGTKADVMDRAEIEAIRGRTKKKGINPWDTDFDEMAKKTVVKRGAKLIRVEPTVRAILAREDEPEEEPAAAVTARTSAPATSRLAARLSPAAEPPQDALSDPDPAEVVSEPVEEAVVRPDPAPEAAPARCDAPSPYDAGSEPCAKEAGHSGPHRNHEKESWT